MVTITVSNHKGGVGKTTTAVNLAAGLARRGHPTLLLDLDPQGHATMGLGIDPEAEGKDGSEAAARPDIAAVFADKRVRLADVLMDTAEPNLKLAPADIRLGRAAKLLNARPVKELVLRRALESVSGFDYVVIDCQPSLEVLTQNALVAADKVLIPTQLAGFSLRGLGDLIETVEEVNEIKSDLGAAPTDWRILLTMVSGHGEERNQAAARILEPVADRILRTQIHRTEAIERSQMESDDRELVPVVLSKTWNRGARDYRNLVKEVAELWPV